MKRNYRKIHLLSSSFGNLKVLFMKIVYCLQSTFNSGGMERIVICKANHLSRLGHEVTIVTTNQRGRNSFFPIDPDVRCLDLGVNYDDIESLPFVKKLIKRQIKLFRHREKLEWILCDIAPDITISTFGNEIVFLHRLKSGGKKVVEIHFSRFYRLQLDQRGIWRLANRWLTYKFKLNVKKYDAFVCLTEEDRLNWNGVKNLHVIPNFIDRRSFEPAALDSKMVITAGRLSFQKGYDRLIDAWKIVHAHCPEWNLEINGSGELKDVLLDKIDSLGLSSSVAIEKPVDDIYDRFSHSSIYVLASRYEGLPMVMLEAMGCGLPIVSFDCQCGPRDLIGNGDAGVLVRNGNVKGLADEIIALIKDVNRRKGMGKSAYREAEKYLPESIIRQWETLFENLTTI